MRKPLDLSKTADFTLAAILLHARSDLSFQYKIPLADYRAAYSFRHHFYAFRSALVRSGNLQLAAALQDFTLTIFDSTVIIENANKLMSFYAGLVESNKPTTLPTADALLAEAAELQQAALLRQAEFFLATAQNERANLALDPKNTQAVLAEMHKSLVSSTKTTAFSPEPQQIGLAARIQGLPPEPTAPIDPHSLWKEHKLLSPGEDVANDTISALFPRATPTTDKPA